MLASDVNLTSLSGPPTAHEQLTVAVKNGMGQLVRLKAIRDTGAPDSVIGEKLARTLNLNIGPTEDSYSTVGSAAEIKFAGVQGCRG